MGKVQVVSKGSWVLLSQRKDIYSATAMFVTPDGDHPFFWHSALEQACKLVAKPRNARFGRHMFSRTSTQLLAFSMPRGLTTCALSWLLPALERRSGAASRSSCHQAGL